jgi:hypothetical protein
MVLVRDRRTEQGEDAITGGLDDIAVVTMNASIIRVNAG